MAKPKFSNFSTGQKIIHSLGWSSLIALIISIPVEMIVAHKSNSNNAINGISNGSLFGTLKNSKKSSIDNF